MVRGAPTALTCFFVGFRTDFVTSVRVLAVSDGVLTLAGLRPARARKRQGGALLPPPLGYVPVRGGGFGGAKLSLCPSIWQILHADLATFESL